MEFFADPDVANIRLFFAAPVSPTIGSLHNSSMYAGMSVIPSPIPREVNMMESGFFSAIASLETTPYIPRDAKTLFAYRSVRMVPAIYSEPAAYVAEIRRAASTLSPLRLLSTMSLHQEQIFPMVAFISETTLLASACFPNALPRRSKLSYAVWMLFSLARTIYFVPTLSKASPVAGEYPYSVNTTMSVGTLLMVSADMLYILPRGFILPLSIP